MKLWLNKDAVVFTVELHNIYVVLEHIKHNHLHLLVIYSGLHDPVLALQSMLNVKNDLAK